MFENAAKKNIDITKVDTVVISHGHMDHGGALQKFLVINPVANIYVQREAFEAHYSKILCFKVPIGLNNIFETNQQVKLINGDFTIDEELSLFTVVQQNKFYSPMNNVLYNKQGKDTFTHEQHLIVEEDDIALFIGCGHAGIVNIMEKAIKYKPRICIGGFHLYNPMTKKTVSDVLLNGISTELQKYDSTQFYTCHCTGKKAYHSLAKRMKNLHYMSCGDVIEI